MKKLVILCLFTLCVAACNKNQMLVNDLDGTWEIRSITALDETDETLPAEGSITFVECGASMQEGGKCDGSFQLSDKAEVGFRYSTFVSGGEKVINILPSQHEEPYLLTGTWQIIEKNKNELKLEGILEVSENVTETGSGEAIKVQILLKK